MTDFTEYWQLVVTKVKVTFATEPLLKTGLGVRAKVPPNPLSRRLIQCIQHFRFPMKPKSNYLGLAGDQKRLT